VNSRGGLESKASGAASDTVLGKEKASLADALFQAVTCNDTETLQQTMLTHMRHGLATEPLRAALSERAFWTAHSPLLAASEQHNFDACRIILEAFADAAEATDAWGNGPAVIAVWSYKPGASQTHLVSFISSVLRLYPTATSWGSAPRPNGQTRGRPGAAAGILHGAARNGLVGVLDASLRWWDAASLSNPRDRGAQCHSCIVWREGRGRGFRSRTGATPLHVACRHGQVATALWLVWQHGLDIEAEDSSGRSAAELLRGTRAKDGIKPTPTELRLMLRLEPHHAGAHRSPCWLERQLRDLQTLGQRDPGRFELQCRSALLGALPRWQRWVRRVPIILWRLAVEHSAGAND
jgi:hypothetical protein